MGVAYHNNKPLIYRKCYFRADTDSEYEMMNHMMLTHGIENESTTISDLRYMHRNNNLERTIEKPITHTGEKTQIHTEKTNENINTLTHTDGKTLSTSTYNQNEQQKSNPGVINKLYLCPECDYSCTTNILMKPHL